jgi:dTDP-4-amino-4,6-dideoxygalactose transaminase
MPSDRIDFAVPGPISVAQSQAMQAACARVIASGRYILGEEVASFETEWAAFVGAPSAVGVANGLDALEIAMRALGVRSGDEVIVPAVSAMATVLAVLRTGAVPVFCDVTQTTALMDLEQLPKLVTSRTRAVIPVHLYGRTVDMQWVVDWADCVNIAVVEDAAQAHGAAWQEQSIGTWGDASAFSFYPTKNLGALGDAGAVTSRREDVLEAARSLRNYGQRSQYDHVDVGMNSRLDEIQAAILRTRLPGLQEATRDRQRIAGRYFTDIENHEVQLPDPPVERDNFVAHLFVVNVSDRASFIHHMGDRGVDCLVHYPKALLDQPALTSMTTANTDLPVARRHVETCVSIPCRPGLDESDVDRVIDAVNAYESP